MILSEQQNQQIALFKDLILKKNQVMNLVSRKNPEKQVQLLFDQAWLIGPCFAAVFKQSSSPILDIGSGNGFPGLFMSILYPKNQFYLCERNRKKAEFLKQSINQARILNARVICENAKDIKQSFDFVISQAAMPTQNMLKLLIKILSNKGQAFLWTNYLCEKSSKNTSFFIHVFKNYKFKNQEHTILKIQKKP